MHWLYPSPVFENFPKLDWMILKTHGSDGLKVKMRNLTEKATNLCLRLKKMGVSYYHNPYINIVTIRAKHLTPQLAQKYALVPDVHNTEPNWYKIVVMDHVKQGVLDSFLNELMSETDVRQYVN